MKTGMGPRACTHGVNSNKKSIGVGSCVRFPNNRVVCVCVTRAHLFVGSLPLINKKSCCINP